MRVSARQAAARAVHWHSSRSHPGHCFPHLDADFSADSMSNGWGLPKFLAEETECFMLLALVKCDGWIIPSAPHSHAPVCTALMCTLTLVVGTVDVCPAW